MEPAVGVRDRKAGFLLFFLCNIFTVKSLATDVSVNLAWRKDFSFHDVEAIVRTKKKRGMISLTLLRLVNYHTFSCSVDLSVQV